MSKQPTPAIALEHNHILSPLRFSSEFSLIIPVGFAEFAIMAAHGKCTQGVSLFEPAIFSTNMSCFGGWCWCFSACSVLVVVDLILEKTTPFFLCALNCYCALTSYSTNCLNDCCLFSKGGNNSLALIHCLYFGWSVLHRHHPSQPLSLTAITSNPITFDSSPPFRRYNPDSIRSNGNPNPDSDDIHDTLLDHHPRF